MSEFKGLDSIITLMNQQEERLSKKIDDVHGDVKQINETVAKHSLKINMIKLKCQNQVGLCQIERQRNEPAVKVVAKLNNISKYPIRYAALFFGVLVGIQIFVMVAIENKWIGLIVDKFIDKI